MCISRGKDELGSEHRGQKTIFTFYLVYDRVFFFSVLFNAMYNRLAKGPGFSRESHISASHLPTGSFVLQAHTNMPGFPWSLRI